MKNIEKYAKYNEQIDRYYKKQLHRNEVITVCKTTDDMMKLGAKPHDIIMKISTLSKIVRVPDSNTNRSAHAISKQEVHAIPQMIEEPAIIVVDRERDSLVLILDRMDYQGDPILIAIKKDCNINGIQGNELKSLYGKKSLAFYLAKFNEKDIFIADINKAEKLSRMAGLQLPASWKVLDFKNSITQNHENVKEIFTYKTRSPEVVSKDVQMSGFHPTKRLIENIMELDHITGKGNTLLEISKLYKQGCVSCTETEIELIQSIAHECMQQELEINIFHERI